MSTLIVYSSRSGYTGECAEVIREELGDDEHVIFTHIDTQQPPTVADYDRIIIGASLRYGRISRKLKRFMEDYRSLLLDRELGLYLTCLSPPEGSQKLFSRVFPRDIREHAKAFCFAGGAADVQSLHILQRKYLEKRFACLDTRNTDELKKFVKKIRKVRKASPAS